MSDTGLPIGWCPRDKNGYLYLSRAQAVKTDANADAARLGSDDTLGAPDLGPFTVVPLYTTPPAAAQDTGRERERLVAEVERCAVDARTSQELAAGARALASSAQVDRLRYYAALKEATIALETFDAARAAGGE